MLRGWNQFSNCSCESKWSNCFQVAVSSVACHRISLPAETIYCKKTYIVQPRFCRCFGVKFWANSQSLKRFRSRSVWERCHEKNDVWSVKCTVYLFSLSKWDTSLLSHISITSAIRETTNTSLNSQSCEIVKKSRELEVLSSAIYTVSWLVHDSHKVLHLNQQRKWHW